MLLHFAHRPRRLIYKAALIGFCSLAPSRFSPWEAPELQGNVGGKVRSEILLPASFPMRSQLPSGSLLRTPTLSRPHSQPLQDQGGRHSLLCPAPSLAGFPKPLRHFVNTSFTQWLLHPCSLQRVNMLLVSFWDHD